VQRRERPETPFGPLPEPIARLAELGRVDFPARLPRPSWPRFALASIVSIVGSLIADAILVAIGTALFPKTAGYVHFRFSDYAKLTVVGVLIACVGWPIVTALSSFARWLFFRLAILVTLVLFLPDLYLLTTGSSGAAVGVLMAMHVAIALVTYNALVHMAPPTRAGRPARREPVRDEVPAHRRPAEASNFPRPRQTADRL
jgi:hypothetical protein